MKNFYVVTNLVKDPDYSLTNVVVKYIKNKGLNCTFVPFSRGFTLGEDKCVDPDNIPDEVECIIVLGGDGTLLQVARDTCSRHIPMIGVNLGDVGYLADVGKDGVFEALDALINDKYHVEKRMMLKGSIYNNDRLILSNIALNDIVISRSNTQKMVNLSTYVDNSYITAYYCDGLIVSSPTGSTSYSLSVGGPIIAPDAEALLVTPIAPHTLTSRSVVFSGKSKITIKQGLNKDGMIGESVVTFDGNIKTMIHTGDRVEVERSNIDVSVIKIYKTSFLDVLSKKMNR